MHLSPEGVVRYTPTPLLSSKRSPDCRIASLFFIRLEDYVGLNDLMAVCVNNLSLVILLMLSPSRNESENENKISQNRSVNIKVISYLSSI